MEFHARFAVMSALAALPVVFAQSPPVLTYIPNSSVKLYQVTGDCDWVQWDATINNKTPTCVPTASKTLTNADIMGDDVPVVFENPVGNGSEMIITFGDTIGASVGPPYTAIQNAFIWGAHDPIGHSSTVHASDGLLVSFYPSSANHGLEVLPAAQPNGRAVDMGTDDTPFTGVSVNGAIYLGIRTGNIANGGGNNDHSMEYSVLTTFNESTLAFTSGRTISALPSGLFVGPSFYLAQPGQLGSPSPVAPDPAVLNFGMGEPGASNIYLSATSSSYFWTGTDSIGNPATRYFAGMSNGNPVWSVNESDSVPIVTDVNPAKPTIERVTVTYSQPLGLWLMIFSGGHNLAATKGMYFTYAQNPWGPWSTPTLIFNDCRDKAFGTFMYYYDTGANTCAGLTSPTGPVGPTISPTVNVPATTTGHSYSPEIVGRFTTISGNTLKLFYMLSTWNPYATVMMESDFSIASNPVTTTLPHVADGNGFDTLVLLINTGTTAANYSLQFFNQIGTQVPYELDPTQSGMTGTIQPGSQAIVRTAGKGTSTNLGWGQLTAPFSVGGMVIYQQQASATSLQEGSAPFTAPSTHFFVPFDNTSGSTTSIGFVNPSATRTATVNFTVRYAEGGTDIVPPFNMNPLQQMAQTVAAIWGKTASQRGLIELNSTVPIGMVAFRFQGAALTLFDTIAPTAGAATPITSTIAHTADGNNFRSTFILTNSGAVAAPYTLNIRNAAAQPQTFNFDVASPLSGTIPAGTTLTIDTTGQGNVTNLGWAQLSAAPAVSGLEVFRQTNQGKSEQQATVPISEISFSHFFLPYDNAANTTSIALANPDPATTATINVTFRNVDGTTSAGQLSLLPQNYVANQLASLFAATAGKAGVAEFTSNVPIAVVEVRFNPTQAFTSLRAVTPQPF